MVDKEKPSSLFPEQEIRSGILTDIEISDLVSHGQLISHDTFQSSSVEASSYDVSVGCQGIVGGDGMEIDLQKEPMELEPGAYGGIISLERFHLPSQICARIGSKRAMAYDGVILLTGSLVDPGYEGHLLFGLYNASQKRVLIRYGRKICNVVFERVNRIPTKQAPLDPNLRIGKFPDAFVDRMANMDVLPWMQISDRVKQIEQITKDILDLKARYEDVLKPIRDLTVNVENLTKDVSALTNQTKFIGIDVEKVNNLVSENSKQITQLTMNLSSVIGHLHSIQDKTHSLDSDNRSREETVTSLRTQFGQFRLLVYIFWGLLLVILGAFLPELFKKIFN